MRRTVLTAACCALGVSGCGSGGSTSGTAASPGATAPQSSTATRTTGFKVSKKPKYGSPAPTGPIQSGVVPIAYRNFSINPDTLRVRVGSTIRWTNYDPAEHNVTSQGGPQRFASRNFGEGASYQITVTRPGAVHYLCTIHPTSMNGTIEVVR